MKSEKMGGRATGRPDDFQTPPWALNPLWPYLDLSWRVWEPACGHGNLVRAMAERGYKAFGSDITHGVDFLKAQYDEFDAVVTNPPYSDKNAWLTRCYELQRPFALLLPLTTLEGKQRQHLFRTHGLEVIILHTRVHFETPTGRTDGTAWFPTAWFTWGLNIGKELTFWQPPTIEYVDDRGQQSMPI